MLALRSVISKLPSSLSTLGLGLVLGVGAAATLGACSEEEPAEQCCEEMKMDTTNSGLICGTDQMDRVALVNGRPSDLFSVCVPLDECPEYCPLEDVNQTVVIPGKAADDPDFVVGEIIPLCVELDVAAGNCCFWTLLIEEGDL